MSFFSKDDPPAKLCTGKDEPNTYREGQELKIAGITFKVLLR